MQNIVIGYARPFVKDPTHLEDPSTLKKSREEYQQSQKKIFKDLKPIMDEMVQRRRREENRFIWKLMDFLDRLLGG